MENMEQHSTNNPNNLFTYEVMWNKLKHDLKQLEQPSCTIEICKTSVLEMSNEEREVRRALERYLEGCGYDHYMSLMEFEKMLDDIILCLVRKKKYWRCIK
jgi:hypothetical protein